MTPVTVHRGDSPIILGFPHTGTFVPTDIAAELNDIGTALADTDWHVDQLYDGLLPQATTVTANFHRYVIDANRDPSGQSLYPGQNTTDLVPLTDFDGIEIWTTPPDNAAIENRGAAFHTPYHAALRTEITRARDQFGVAILFDCHSIRSNIPHLFAETLPDFNIGTNHGATCAPSVATAVSDICRAASGYSMTENGRFKGGWTTRHYGQPHKNIHAIQMELAQATYLTAESPPWQYDPAKAARIRPYLQSILTALADLAPSLGGSK